MERKSLFYNIMIIASVSEIKAKFSSYLKKTMAGEDVIISSHNVPIAALKAIKKNPEKQKVKMGLAKGKVKINGDFNSSMKNFENEFYNNDLISE